MIYPYRSADRKLLTYLYFMPVFACIHFMVNGVLILIVSMMRREIHVALELRRLKKELGTFDYVAVVQNLRFFGRIMKVHMMRMPLRAPRHLFNHIIHLLRRAK